MGLFYFQGRGSWFIDLLGRGEEEKVTPISTICIHLRSRQFARCSQELGRRPSPMDREQHRNHSWPWLSPGAGAVLSSLWAFN